MHFEITTADQKRAEDFYSKVFGWKISPMPEMSYTMLETTETEPKVGPTKPGAINGGMMKRTDDIKNPVITIQVDDIEASLKTIEQNGGKTLKPKQDVGGMGFSAYFIDSEGNVMGLWQMPK